MTRNARNRFVAWLGIAAMWLAIVAPVISQIAAHQAGAEADAQAAFCTADALVGAASHAAHEEPALADSPTHDEHASHHDGAGHFDACAYCGLLAHNLPIPWAAAPDVARIERVSRVATLVSVSDAARTSFNAAHPRAPPVLS